MDEPGNEPPSPADPLQKAWLSWAHENLGRDPVRADAAATAAREAIAAGLGLNGAAAAAKAKWEELQAPSAVPPSDQPLEQPSAQPSGPPPDLGIRLPPEALKDRLAAWLAAGVVDGETAARIEAFEAARPAADRGSGGIGVAEVIAYIGAVVLLVGVSFLYQTQHDALGPTGRLVLLGLVVVAGLAAGELIRLMGNTGASRRARSAGWSVAALAATVWFAEAFTDGHILTQPLQYPYPGSPDDTSGSIMLAALIGFVIATAFLWSAGAGLLAFVAGALAYTAALALDAFLRPFPSGWGGELSFLVSAAALGVLSEAITRGHERRWAREVLRFLAVVPPTFVALTLSGPDVSLELLAGLIAIGAFGLAWLRGSAGYAIAGGIALFVVVNEFGFRHFAQSVGFPVVLIVSGITLFGVAGGLFGLLPRLRRSR